MLRVHTWNVLFPVFPHIEKNYQGQKREYNVTCCGLDCGE